MIAHLALNAADVSIKCNLEFAAANAKATSQQFISLAIAQKFLPVKQKKILANKKRKKKHKTYNINTNN